MDFILDQYRTCWGWALEDGRTTWVEVFDIRWSHSHQWSGSPTWQLSRYVLGLRPRYDLGMHHYELSLHPGTLPGASGTIPFPREDGLIRVKWNREDGGIHYHVNADRPIWIHGLPGSALPVYVQAECGVILPPIC